MVPTAVASAQTVSRIKRQLAENPPAPVGTYTGAGRALWVIVRCTSATAAAGSGVGAQCYPGRLTQPRSEALAANQPSGGAVWLTLIEGTAAVAPESGKTYVGILVGNLSIGGDDRPRVIAAAPVSKRFGFFARLTTSSDNGGAWSVPRWKWHAVKSGSTGVPQDDGGESATFNAIPHTIDGTNRCNPAAGLRVWMWESKESGFYEFLPIGYASVTDPGLVSIAAQTFNGVKTFDDQIIVNEGQAGNTTATAVKVRGNDYNGITGGAYDLMTVASSPYDSGGSKRSGTITIGVDNGASLADPPSKKINLALYGDSYQYGSQEIYAYDTGGVNYGLVRVGSTAAGFGIEIESSVDGANVYLTTTTFKVTGYEPTLRVDDGIYADGWISTASGFRVGGALDAGDSATDALGNVFAGGIVTNAETNAATARTNLGIGGGLSGTYNLPGATTSGDLQTITFTNGVLTGVTYVP